MSKWPKVEYIIRYTPNNNIIRNHGRCTPISCRLHEFRHALYYIDDKYRKFCDKTWAEYLSDEQREKVTKYLKDAGYHDKVIRDEFRAYYYTSGHNIFAINPDLADYPRKINRKVIKYSL